jgi:hypothetical protein
MLPVGCRYSFQHKTGSLNRPECFNTGMKLAEPNRDLLIFSDCDIFIEEWDICGNLRMCERFDAVTGFRNIIELSSSDTSMLHKDTAVLLRWFKANSYSTVEKRGLADRFAIFHRRSIEAAGGWREQPESSDSPSDAGVGAAGKGGNRRLLSVPATGLRVFESPNSALRMYRD